MSIDHGPDRAAWIAALGKRMIEKLIQRRNLAVPTDEPMLCAIIAAEWAETLVEQSQCARCMKGGPEWSEALEAEG